MLKLCIPCVLCRVCRSSIITVALPKKKTKSAMFFFVFGSQNVKQTERVEVASQTERERGGGDLESTSRDPTEGRHMPGRRRGRGGHIYLGFSQQVTNTTSQ